MPISSRLYVAFCSWLGICRNYSSYIPTKSPQYGMVFICASVICPKHGKTHFVSDFFGYIRKIPISYAQILSNPSINIWKVLSVIHFRGVHCNSSARTIRKTALRAYRGWRHCFTHKRAFNSYRCPLTKICKHILCFTYTVWLNCYGKIHSAIKLRKNHIDNCS